MNERPYLPPHMDITEEELAMLDVDLERSWHGVMGEVWSRPVGPVERLARKAFGSAALARVLIVSPLLILAWIIASALVFALGIVVTQATEQPLIPLIAPALAAVGVAYAYGARADVAFEISRTMPVSGRMILLVRMTVVYAICALLCGIASLFAPALGGVTALWLLPMVAISILGLAVATLTGLPALGGAVALLFWSGIVMRPVLEQRREDTAAPLDLGTVVSESALTNHAPMYVAVILVCGAIVMWNTGAFGHTQEDARWHW